VKTVAITRFADPETGDKGRIEVLESPVRALGPTDVLIKVAYCSICGSDAHLLADGKMVGYRPPFQLGHEVSGTVAELGPDATVSGLKVGDRVSGNFLKACGTCIRCRNGQPNLCVNDPKGGPAGMAEYLVWDEQQVFRIPDSVSLEEACLTEPLAVAMRAIERADIRLGDRVAVSGAGSLGLMLVQLAKMAGASSVTVIEPVEAKVRLATELGADHGIDPQTGDVPAEAMRITGGLGFDSVIESSGARAAAGTVLDILASAGTAVYFAIYHPDAELSVNLNGHFLFKEQTIRGFMNARFTDFSRAVDMLPIDDAPSAFAAQATGQYAKILIKC
jgi:(R,R)-butanediol dehydrogenase/meso-butanediol dehydrogenase/diacetyl reductase/L-iditol 2-dehydrogenase